MRSFPLPIRVAAGLAATAVEQTRQLPSNLLGLPVTIVSQALQASMRVQQQVTELAIKGDEILADWQATEEQPAWATFDEDEPGWQPTVVTEQGVVDEDPTVLPDYDQLSVAQLRGKLRKLSESELAQLLDHERSQDNRPEFLRMLSNRLDRVRSAE